jgi:hypothetical protein
MGTLCRLVRIRIGGIGAGLCIFVGWTCSGCAGIGLVWRVL